MQRLENLPTTSSTADSSAANSDREPLLEEENYLNKTGERP